MIIALFPGSTNFRKNQGDCDNLRQIPCALIYANPSEISEIPAILGLGEDGGWVGVPTHDRHPYNADVITGIPAKLRDGGLGRAESGPGAN